LGAAASEPVPAIVAAALASQPDAHLPALRAYVRANAEDRPGVYRMLGAGGEVLYVGKSKHVRTRLLSYFRGRYPEDKGARILRDTAHLEWEYAPSEFAALLRELRLIKRFRPRFNVQLKRDEHHWSFIKLTKGPRPSSTSCAAARERRRRRVLRPVPRRRPRGRGGARAERRAGPARLRAGRADALRRPGRPVRGRAAARCSARRAASATT
jgi:hypothetical protein